MLSRALAICVPVLFWGSAVCAYTLPPKVQEGQLSTAALRALPQREAKKVEIIWDQPVLHGGIGLSPDRKRLLILGPDASQVTDIHLTENMVSPSYRRTYATPNDVRNRILKHSFEAGAFTVKDSRLFYKPEKQMPGPLWEIALGFSPVGVLQSRSGAITGWAPYPAKLFIFPSDYRYVYKWEGPEDSEPVVIESCDSRQFLMLENLKSGRNRLVRFEGSSARSYSLFDFSDGTLTSDATNLAAASCEDIFISGSFGVARARFDTPARK